MRLATGISLVLWLLAATTFAEDIEPPVWRGVGGTQMIQWEFKDDPGTYPPSGGLQLPFDVWNTVGFTTTAPVLTHVPGPGAGWHAQQPTFELGGTGLYDPMGDPGDGWLNLSGELTIELGNVPAGNPHKEIWIQLVWEPQASGNKPALQLAYDSTTTPEWSIPVAREVLWLGSDFDSANPWRTVFLSVYHVNIFPNPAAETLFIRGGINVDELVIDTVCVSDILPQAPIPEPASLSIIGLGLVVILRRRLRR